MRALFLSVLMLVSFSQASIAAETLERFPWEWGTECPFPWSKIDGYYKVRSVNAINRMDNTYLKLESTEPESQSDNNVLEVFQYDRNQQLQAVGMAVAKNQERIITAYTRKLGEEKATAKIMIRTYIADAQKGADYTIQACLEQQQVVTATFCSMRGRKCKETQNYVLVRVKQ